ncbi:hypothetical protein SZ64_13035 [Erythrobacter sp. SG61-1L]|uniref:DUF2793 domain-containing protein n=1 Tax=Erythrobacter sp. SG61-1L TaxID=1603897 RepID=UPI0006C90EB6|nr:DUF2793 domain-containing protein [Erythrobacter sp. SG61-1L]KPL68943.1 hypothetical protein SZ64_13035 [Erythrobacter sp. SG61-1L]
MPDPISFTSTSPRFALPLLFAGQAQKEFHVNEAHVLIDALLHPAVEGEAGAPPAAPDPGECWLIGAAPSGAWAGHAGELACWSAGAWIFAPPRDGMRLLDRSTGQTMPYLGGWNRPAAPALPTGGTTVDTQARTAIAGLIAALVDAGILPSA